MVIAVSYGIGVNVMLGAQCAALPELFGNRHRYIGVAVARETSAILAGGIAPFVGALLLSLLNNSWMPLAIYVLILSVITLATTFHTPETRARDLDPAVRRGRGHRAADHDGPTRWRGPTRASEARAGRP